MLRSSLSCNVSFCKAMIHLQQILLLCIMKMIFATDFEIILLSSDDQVHSGRNGTSKRCKEVSCGQTFSHLRPRDTENLRLELATRLRPWNTETSWHGELVTRTCDSFESNWPRTCDSSETWWPNLSLVTRRIPWSIQFYVHELRLKMRRTC